MTDVREFLKKRQQGIFDNDFPIYAATTTVADLGLYEWRASRLATRNCADRNLELG